MPRRRHPLVYLAALLLAARASGDKPVRVATYNIAWLSSENAQCGTEQVRDVRTQGARLSRLRDVVTLLDADIIGLQEIRDRAALELLFPPADWTVVIDDESDDCQNLALAVRKPLEVVGAVDDRLNAGPEQFLFEGMDDWLFPGRRDVLCVEVQLPENAGALYVMVHHAKSRSEGRRDTEERRVGAATEIVQELNQTFRDKDYVLVGDFNDNPDDASLNILETGDPNAVAEMENDEGTFLVNLAEPLLEAGHVSCGWAAGDVHDGQAGTIDPESRQRNYEHRNDNSHMGAILFDQILVPQRSYERYVRDSAAVLDQPVAVEGPRDEMASDHLPVYADFVFPGDGGEGGQAGKGGEGGGGAVVAVARIVGLLPDPVGHDEGQEVVLLKNLGQHALSLQGWVLCDRAGHTYALSGSIGAGRTLRVTMTTFDMPLNNDGDAIRLLDPNEAVIDKVDYAADQVQRGVMIRWGE